jgi:hypothetical protein
VISEWWIGKELEEGSGELLASRFDLFISQKEPPVHVGQEARQTSHLFLARWQREIFPLDVVSLNDPVTSLCLICCLTVIWSTWCKEHRQRWCWSRAAKGEVRWQVGQWECSSANMNAFHQSLVGSESAPPSVFWIDFKTCSLFLCLETVRLQRWSVTVQAPGCSYLHSTRVFLYCAVLCT